MINITQVILVVVITTLTILLTVIGIQIAYILKDLRHALSRVNKIIDDVELISAAVVRPVTSLSNLVDGIQSSIKLAELLGLVKTGAKQVAKELPERVKDLKNSVAGATQRMMGQSKVVEDSDSGRDDSELLESDQDALEADDSERDVVKSSGKTRRYFPHFFHRSGTPLG